MPTYIYQHPKTKKTIEVVQSVHDKHEYFDKRGVKWDRVFTSPMASTDTNIDPFSSQAFVDKTRYTKDNMGGIWDRSKEMSEKRASKNGGVDPVKQKAIEEHKKKYKKPHPEEIKANRQKKINIKFV